jgi:hypothetical protein
MLNVSSDIPFMRRPFIRRPFMRRPFIRRPLVTNPFIESAFSLVLYGLVRVPPSRIADPHPPTRKTANKAG